MFLKPQNQVVIDYITMTSKIHSQQQVKELLGMSNAEFIPIRSYYGYQNCDYCNGVRIHWSNNDKVSEVCIDCSGKGCRTVEGFNKGTSWNWYNFFKFFEEDIKSRDVHISRVDIASDDFSGILDMNTITSYTQARKYVCRAKCEPWGTWGRKVEVYYGSEKSDRLLRFYDKKLEQKREDIEHWIRVEMQCRNDSAVSFILNYLSCPDIGKLYSGVLLDYLRFTTQPNKRSDNAHRLHTASFWAKFLGNVERIKQCYLQGQDYTLMQLDNYVEGQTASSIRTYLIAHGGDVTSLIDCIKNVRLNERQRGLLQSMLSDDSLRQLVERNINKLEKL
jgi:DNA relaxase NicK